MSFFLAALRSFQFEHFNASPTNAESEQVFACCGFHFVVFNFNSKLFSISNSVANAYKCNATRDKFKKVRISAAASERERIQVAMVARLMPLKCQNDQNWNDQMEIEQSREKREVEEVTQRNKRTENESPFVIVILDWRHPLCECFFFFSLSLSRPRTLPHRKVYESTSWCEPFGMVNHNGYLRWLRLTTGWVQFLQCRQKCTRGASRCTWKLHFYTLHSSRRLMFLNCGHCVRVRVKLDCCDAYANISIDFV